MENISSNIIDGLSTRLCPLQVLIVDDDLGPRKLLGALVGQLGGEALEAANGQDGLTKALKFRPNMIIADCRMPSMDGVEMIEAIRREAPREYRPYILVGIGPHEEGNLGLAMAAGADDWIAKPLQQEAVLGRLRLGSRFLQVRLDNLRQAEKLQQQAEELARSNERFRHLALMDELTGLPNRRFALEYLQRAWTTNDHPLACLMVDLDSFKKVNHAYGREGGNDVLKSVASTMVDGMPSGHVVCRLSGDRFVVICPTGLEQATELGKILLQQIWELAIQVNGDRLGMSIGVAERRPDIQSPTELLYIAERGMYQAKFNGRNRVMSGNSPFLFRGTTPLALSGAGETTKPCSDTRPGCAN